MTSLDQLSQISKNVDASTRSLTRKRSINRWATAYCIPSLLLGAGLELAGITQGNDEAVVKGLAVTVSSGFAIESLLARNSQLTQRIDSARNVQRLINVLQGTMPANEYPNLGGTEVQTHVVAPEVVKLIGESKAGGDFLYDSPLPRPPHPGQY